VSLDREFLVRLGGICLLGCVANVLLFCAEEIFQLGVVEGLRGA
jgi:hypothetical protein